MEEFKLYKHIKFVNEKAYLFIHQGFGDLFNLIGLINYYSIDFDKIVLFALNESRLKVLESIYENNKNIKVCIPNFEKNVISKNTCFNCMMSPSLNNCRRNNSIKCKTVNYDNLNVILTGSFKNYKEWEIFKLKEFSFAHAFYSYNKINFDARFEYFHIFNNKQEEQRVYDKFIKIHGKDYILIHEDNQRNILIGKKFNNCVNLNKISKTFFDTIKVLENTLEIHLIDSIWACFIFLLDKKFFLFKDKPIFVYLKRGYKEMFENAPSNWKII